MSDKIQNVLFICTGNSARSILAEGIMNELGAGRLRAFSAGSTPRGEVHPLALKTLARLGMPHDGYRSKSWDEFALADAPVLDYVLTVCDKAAHETCPIWPGQPMTAHWGVADPAAFIGTAEQQEECFMATALVLKRRIELMLALPTASLSSMSLQGQIQAIGKI